MTFRKPKRKPTTLSDLCHGPCCGCSMRCKHPGCTYPCMGGHANYPDKHWCPENHFWTEPYVPVTGKHSNRW